MENLIGQSLGRYHIVEQLGQGGMASVFKAYDTSLERHVAVKIIRTDVVGGSENEFLLRFRREAKALAQLDHPFILKVLDFGEQDGIPYLVMPFVSGGTLKEMVGKPIPYRQAAAFSASVAQALEYAHSQRIIHRDVKPANILISQSGAPLLSDFGIAKILASNESTQLTATGVGIGTPDYMAPEQWAGEADPRTDIYSLGVIFYEMVTGRRPFTADTPAAVLVKHLRDPLPRPKSINPSLPDSVELVLFMALDKEPGNRFESMAAFASALEKLAREETSALDLETIQGGFTVPFEKSTVKIPPVALPKKTGNERLGFFALAIIVVFGIFCLTIGALAWLSFSGIMNLNSREILTPTEELLEPDIDNPPAQITQENTQVITPQLPVVFATQNLQPTPFTSIEGYPEDVPLLIDNKGDLAITTSEGTTMFTFSTDLSFQEAADFYNTGMLDNGWEETAKTQQGNQTIWYYMKDDGARMVMVTIFPEEGVCRIMIMLVGE